MKLLTCTYILLASFCVKAQFEHYNRGEFTADTTEKITVFISADEPVDPCLLKRLKQLEINFKYESAWDDNATNWFNKGFKDKMSERIENELSISYADIYSIDSSWWSFFDRIDNATIYKSIHLNSVITRDSICLKMDSTLYNVLPGLHYRFLKPFEGQTYSDIDLINGVTIPKRDGNDRYSIYYIEVLDSMVSEPKYCKSFNSSVFKFPLKFVYD